MRALFSRMFAEDVGLLPARAFTELLQSLADNPRSFAPMVENLWQTMNTGGFSPILRSEVLRFNGGLFTECAAIALDRDQIGLLIEASSADWRYVEPAIFEHPAGARPRCPRAPQARRPLHSRAYVERLVLPTVSRTAARRMARVQDRRARLGSRPVNTSEAVAEGTGLPPPPVHRAGTRPGLRQRATSRMVTLEHYEAPRRRVPNLLHDLGQS